MSSSKCRVVGDFVWLGLYLVLNLLSNIFSGGSHKYLAPVMLNGMRVNISPL